MSKLKKILEIFNNKQLLLLERYCPYKYKDIIAEVRIEKFIREKWYDSIDTSNGPICVINQGEFQYPLFQMSFLNNMIINAVDCLSKGYTPIIQFLNNENVNLWEQFLEQPFINESSDGGIVSYYPLQYAQHRFPNFPNNEDINNYAALFKRFVVFNNETKDYLNEEYETILHNKKVIGVLCRGTDYTSNKPKMHPIQPEPKEIIECVKRKMTELNCDFIYLATEEEALFDLFDKAFPGKVLTNKRCYYDEFYSIKGKIGDDARISQVHHDRVNDNYYKSLEYFSSLYLLSKCDALIGGNTGGSRAALYLNGGKYKYWNLFNLGEY